MDVPHAVYHSVVRGEHWKLHCIEVVYINVDRHYDGRTYRLPSKFSFGSSGSGARFRDTFPHISDASSYLMQSHSCPYIAVSSQLASSRVRGAGCQYHHPAAAVLDIAA